MLQPMTPGDTGHVIRLAAKIAWQWELPADPALEQEDLCQEAILAGLSAAESWTPARGKPLESWVFYKVRMRLLFVCARSNPKRRTQGFRYRDDDPSRERPMRFTEMERVYPDGEKSEPWEPTAPTGPDCLTLMQRAFILAAIDREDALTRRLLRAHLDGKDIRAFAPMIGISEHQAYYRIKTGMKRLRELLLPGEEPPVAADWRARFLVLIRGGERPYHACRRLEIDPHTPVTERYRNPAFKAAYEAAREEAAR